MDGSGRVVSDEWAVPGFGKENPVNARIATALAAALVLVCLVPVAARADEVTFNNGDRLTGKVVSVEGGKMTIETKVAGAITVDMKDVKTFTTDAPISVRTTGGQRFSAKAVSDQAGTVKLEGATAATAPQSLPLAQVKTVNFNENWTGAIIGGAMFSRGNTFSDQASIAFDLTRRSEDDRWTFNGAYNFGRQRDPSSGDKTTTTDNWFAAGKYDRFMSEKLYWFGSLRYEHDRIAELDHRVTPSLGLGYQWVETPDFSFNTEGGVAYICEQFSNDESNSAIALRVAYHLKKKLNDRVSLFHNLEYFPSLESLDDYLIVADAGIRADITSRIFAEYRMEFRYDATPAEGASRSDLRHLIGVGWKF